MRMYLPNWANVQPTSLHTSSNAASLSHTKRTTLSYMSVLIVHLTENGPKSPLYSIPTVYNGWCISSSIARQPRWCQLLIPNDMSSESSRQDVSSADLFGTDAIIPTVEISSMKDRPRGCGIPRSIRVLAVGWQRERGGTRTSTLLLKILHEERMS